VVRNDGALIAIGFAKKSEAQAWLNPELDKMGG
jgi:hypothetical protein